jgi:hypothetical protein
MIVNPALALHFLTIQPPVAAMTVAAAVSVHHFVP